MLTVKITDSMIFSFQIMFVWLLYAFKRSSVNSLFLKVYESTSEGPFDSSILPFRRLYDYYFKKSSITPFCVTAYSTVPCVPLGVGLDPVDGDVGLDPVYGYVGFEPADGYVGLDPLDGYVGLDPVDGNVGLDPVYGYVGFEPADGYVGLDPVDG
ncbi:hypothetical protein T10_2094 [Trichinella papuae]|uniref:Uncharacterized protein n=1 Tax=Trichinella papuae TaxID=268474 RepID=A0A0V1N5B0_9BILA|nr:hypothetical protein T10_2094 [Trichinella papuae]